MVEFFDEHLVELVRLMLWVWWGNYLIGGVGVNLRVIKSRMNSYAEVPGDRFNSHKPQ